MMCVMCQMGLPSSCLGESCEQTEQTTTVNPVPLEILSQQIAISNGYSDTEDADSMDERRGVSTRRGRSKNLSQSAGRKVAARRYPLNKEAACEWQGSANVGGGNYPILGCPPGTGKQEARHHGPEKNVANNEQGNVHRICHYCHYRWHRKNDDDYDAGAGYWPPHNPRPLTEEELQTQVLDYMRYLAEGKRSNRGKKEVIDD
jgi:hypothetical protein